MGTANFRLDGSDNRVYLSPGGEGSGEDKEEVEGHSFQAQGLWRKFCKSEAAGERCALISSTLAELGLAEGILRVEGHYSAS